jgi:SRSO17 transposase
MDEGEFRRLAGAFRRFHRQFAPLFGRKEARRRSAQYLRGLLVQREERRNAENVAEAIDGASPRALQRFLTDAPWAPEPVLAALQTYVAERLLPDDPAGEEVAADGVWLVDDTGFAKRGDHSVGVARQYSGTLGKVDTCQIGVFLGYATGRGATLVDGCLFLPEAWTADPDRCRAAGVPEDVLVTNASAHETKVDLALAMLGHARARGSLPGRWVTADEHYGQSPTFRDTLDAWGYWYVAEVPCTTPVFPDPPKRRPVRLAPTGPARPVEVLPASQPVQALATALPATAWTTLTVAEGAQGPRAYQFAARRVWESRDGVPGRAGWAVWRRNLDGSELKHYLSNAPAKTPLAVLARVGATRWTVETAFEQGKGEVGLDEYEVRSWAGWHHHVTLVLLALAFLLTVQQDWGEKDAGRHRTASGPRPGAGAPPPPLDPRRPAPLAGRHPGPQRPRHSFPRQTPRPHAA